MNPKRCLVLLCLALMAVCLLTGCSRAEMGYYNLQKEINGLQLYESTGEITFNLEQIPSFDGEDTAAAALIRNILNNTTLTYTTKFDVNKQIFLEQFYLKGKNGDNPIELLSVINSGDSLYIRVDELYRYLKSYDDPDLNRTLDRLLGGVTYIKLDPEELSELLRESMINSAAPGDPGQLQPPLPGYPSFSINLKKQQTLNQKILDGLIRGYERFETGLVKQEGNKYIITADAADMIKTLNAFLHYTFTNGEQVGDALKGVLNSLDDEEMAMLGLDPAKKSDYILAIDTFTAALAEGSKEFLPVLEEEMSKNAEEVIRLLEGSGFTATLVKVDEKTYRSTTDMTVRVKDPDNPAGSFGFTMGVKNTVRITKPFTVAIPTAGIITLTELQARMPKVMAIAVDKDSYTISQGLITGGGNIDVQLIDDRTYLPLRTVAVLLDEKVGWDPEAHRAYVEKNGNKLDMTGIILNDRTYVRIRDFEKLGYRVNWNGDLKIAEIVKN